MCQTLNRLIVQYSVTIKVNKHLFITAATWFGQTETIISFLCEFGL